MGRRARPCELTREVETSRSGTSSGHEADFADNRQQIFKVSFAGFNDVNEHRNLLEAISVSESLHADRVESRASDQIGAFEQNRRGKAYVIGTIRQKLTCFCRELIAT